MNHAFTSRAILSRRRTGGFTLIELMITVAIVGILAAVALPSYRNYAIRGKLVEGTNALAALRAQMEQYYQDNRTYQSLTTPTVINSPCSPTVLATAQPKSFTLSCSVPVPAAGATPTYLLTATGNAGTMVANAAYTVNQSNVMATTVFPAAWGTVPSGTTCWLMKKGDSC